jgi:CheY-like chemotaxis protein
MSPPLSILLVEDSEDDVFLMERAVRTTRLEFALTIKPHGQAAIDHLARPECGSVGGEPLPDLIFLDLQLPYQTGFDVLRWIRNQPKTRSSVVIVLTSSAQQRDVDQAFALGANSYVVKPSSPAELRLMLTDLQHYWLQWNRFPARSVPAGTAC